MTQSITNPSQWPSLSIPELNQTLQSLQSIMLQHQHSRQYTEAQNYRTLYQQCKNYILDRNLANTEQKYKALTYENNNNRIKQLQLCTQKWQIKMKQYNNQCNKLSKQLLHLHKQQVQALRLQLQQQLSPIVKQSKQLINLRIMEQHAANQKNFVEAHSIQQKVNKLYQSQKNIWMANRQKNIQKAIKNLKNKHNIQIQGIQHRIKLTLQDYSHEKYKNQQDINQRYDNLLKQLRAKHQREILSLHGQLRNLGGKSSPGKKSKDVSQSSENVKEEEVSVQQVSAS